MSIRHNRSGVFDTALLIVLIVFCAVATFHIQSRLDSKFPYVGQVEDFKYLPSGNFLKGAALSFDEVFADLLWIKALGYFGEHVSTDQNYQWLNRLIEVATTLDPYFEDPYEFGGVILSWEMGDVDAGTKVLGKGMENVPQHHLRYWYLPFYTGFNYMYYKKDYQTAAKYLKQAASFPQSPSYLPLLVSRLYANTDAPELAIPFLKEMLDRASTPEMRVQFENRIKDITILQHIKVLTSASEKFHKHTGGYPKEIQDLKNAGFLKSIPDEPYGGQYEIMENGSVKSTSNSDQMELHINKKEKAPLITIEERK